MAYCELTKHLGRRVGAVAGGVGSPCQHSEVVFGAYRGQVAIVRGARSRDKLVRIEGLTAIALRRALGLPAHS